jgi:hypothetical protein
MTDWRLEDKEFKVILHRNNNSDDEEVSVANTKAELIPHLKTHKAWIGLQYIVIQDIERAKTFHSLNKAISLLYDYADAKKIWLGFMPMD